MSLNIVVTGGAGFIGCNFTRFLLQGTDYRVLVLDKLTYAGSRRSLVDLLNHPRFEFRELDLADGVGIRRALAEFQPDAVVHLAAESHVDRSIDAPAVFMDTNILGTFTLLQEIRRYLASDVAKHVQNFRLIHCSTDEVFGSLEDDAPAFVETSRYAPRSPYSASKAAADHLVHAWQATYGVPAIITHSSNNYGPYQYPEKLIPVVITRALADQPIPIFGTGRQIRDWIHVSDHCRGLLAVLERGRLGEHYNIGANCERENLSLVREICALLDTHCPRSDGCSYALQISHVSDRPGHDHRYALNIDKMTNEIDWRPQVSFSEGLQQTVRWYVSHLDWCRHMLDRAASSAASTAPLASPSASAKPLPTTVTSSES